jgi:hypothetical protein
VWKNADAALAGRGDVDSVAPKQEWGRVIDHFARWVKLEALGTLIICEHLPETLVLLAVDAGADRREVVELDVCAEAAFRFCRLFRAEDLQHLMQMDPRGFRRLRPGAEGFFLFLFNGVGRAGRLNMEGLDRKGALRLLAQDPEGARFASRLLGSSGNTALRATTDVTMGSMRWSRTLALFELGSLARSFARPRTLASRAWFRFVGRKQCPVVRTLSAGRRLPDDRNVWLEQVSRSHRVLRPMELVDK